MTIEPLVPPDEFFGLNDMTHLCAGGEAPWLRRQLDVYERFAELKSSSYDGREIIFDHGENCRKKIGKLWGVDSERVSVLPTAADGMGLIAQRLDWRSGDNIVTTNLEFPSVAYAWKDVAKKWISKFVWCPIETGGFTKRIFSTTLMSEPGFSGQPS